MGRPTPELFRVLGYLYRNRYIGLRYETAHDASLEGFSDSDWAVKHPTSVYSFHRGSAGLLRNRLLILVRGRDHGGLRSCEGGGLPLLLPSRAGHGPLSTTSALKLDSKSAIDLVYHPEHHSKTKHIERRHCFICECVENGKLRVPFVPTKENCANFFTKPMFR